jgi:hypothetical protein
MNESLVFIILFYHKQISRYNKFTLIFSAEIKKKQYAVPVNYEMSKWVEHAFSPHMFPMKNSEPACPEWSKGTIYRCCKMLLAVFSDLEYPTIPLIVGII